MVWQEQDKRQNQDRMKEKLNFLFHKICYTTEGQGQQAGQSQTHMRVEIQLFYFTVEDYDS